MKRLKKEGWGGKTISDNQRLPTAKMVHAFCSSTANELQRYCKRFAELCSEKLLMNRTVMRHCYQDFLR